MQTAASPMEIPVVGPQNLEIALPHDAAVQLLGIRELHILIDVIDHWCSLLLYVQ